MEVSMVWLCAVAVWFDGSLSILPCLYGTKFLALGKGKAYLIRMDGHDHFFWTSLNTFVYRHARSECKVIQRTLNDICVL